MSPGSQSGREGLSVACLSAEGTQFKDGPRAAVPVWPHQQLTSSAARLSTNHSPTLPLSCPESHPDGTERTGGAESAPPLRMAADGEELSRDTPHCTEKSFQRTSMRHATCPFRRRHTPREGEHPLAAKCAQTGLPPPMLVCRNRRSNPRLEEAEADANPSRLLRLSITISRVSPRILGSTMTFANVV